MKRDPFSFSSRRIWLSRKYLCRCFRWSETNRFASFNNNTIKNANCSSKPEAWLPFSILGRGQSAEFMRMMFKGQKQEQSAIRSQFKFCVRCIASRHRCCPASGSMKWNYLQDNTQKLNEAISNETICLWNSFSHSINIKFQNAYRIRLLAPRNVRHLLIKVLP